MCSSDLKQLYNAILGTNNGSLADIERELQGFYTVSGNGGTYNLPNVINSENIRVNNGKNILVNFGGVQWEVVYVTRTGDSASGGDVILDLFQATASVNSSFSTKDGNSQYNLTSINNPSHVYSTSYVRSVTLNAGTTYQKFNGRIASSYTNMSSTQSTSNAYAKFTMPSTTAMGRKSLTDYIAKPAEVKYQEVESSPGLFGVTDNYGAGYNVNFPNDAYGTPYVENYKDAYRDPSGNQLTGRPTSSQASTYLEVNSGYGGNGVNVFGNGTNIKAGYGDWANDYIWIPSVTEVAPNNNSSRGIWALDNEQRINVRY